jgi:hypothetical protein
MSQYVWDLSGTDRQCDSYAPGHLIHCIHFNHSMREPSVVIPVTASVDDDGLVHIEGDGISLVRWNHRPALLRAALQHFGGRADWKPRWYLLAVPTEAFMGSARSVFSLATLDDKRECFVLDRSRTV